MRSQMASARIRSLDLQPHDWSILSIAATAAHYDHVGLGGVTFPKRTKKYPVEALVPPKISWKI